MQANPIAGAALPDGRPQFWLTTATGAASRPGRSPAIRMRRGRAGSTSSARSVHCPRLRKRSQSRHACPNRRRLVSSRRSAAWRVSEHEQR